MHQNGFQIILGNPVDLFALIQVEFLCSVKGHYRIGLQLEYAIASSVVHIFPNSKLIYLIALCSDAASETRPVDPEYARGHKTMFSDMYPYMLLSQVSQVAT